MLIFFDGNGVQFFLTFCTFVLITEVKKINISSKPDIERLGPIKKKQIIIF